MAINRLNIDDFLLFSGEHVVLDVRSPGEFQHAHIPGAVSFPLFTNEERSVVGTAYKQESREKAIKIGLEYFGRNMVNMVEAAEKIISSRKGASREVGVHCWRGGMRSAAVAWLLDLYGFKVTLLSGGYKAYRHWALRELSGPRQLWVLGGCTGGNKTGVLTEMGKTGCVIDLEALALHKGSAYGNLDFLPQPSQEQFENLLAAELARCARQFPGKPVWVEAESQRLGSINIPQVFFMNMRRSPMVFLDIPFERRLEHIVQGYGSAPKEKLINATLRIKKKLGGLETKNAINFLLEDDVKSCFAILLKYYDKLYLKSIASKEFGDREIVRVESATTSAKANYEKILVHANRNN